MGDKKTKVLLIENNESLASVVGNVLDKAPGKDFSMDVSEELIQGLKRLDEHSYDVLLLGVSQDKN